MIHAVAPGFCRAACGIALDDEKLVVGVVFALSRGELVGNDGVDLLGLAAAGGFLRLAGRFARHFRCRALLDEVDGEAFVLGEVVHQVRVDEIVEQRSHFGRIELSLGLGFVLEDVLRDLDRNDRGEALAHVVSIELLAFFDDAVLDGPVIDGTGQSGLEARFVGTAIVGADVVGVGNEVVVVILVAPLHRHFHADGVVGFLDALGIGEIQNIAQRVFVLIQRGDVLLKAVFVEEFDRLPGALVLQHEMDLPQKESLLAQMVVDGIPFEFDRREDRFVGLEADQGPVLPGVSDFLQGGLQLSAVFPADVVSASLTEHGDVQIFGKGVGDRGSDAMETRRGLIGFIGEFSARVELRVDQFDRRLPGRLMDVDRDAAPLVFDGDGSVFVEGDVNMVPIAIGGLIDAVVDDLPNQMVQAGGVGRADVHARPFPHAFQLRKDLDVLRGI